MAMMAFENELRREEREREREVRELTGVEKILWVETFGLQMTLFTYELVEEYDGTRELRWREEELTRNGASAMMREARMDQLENEIDNQKRVDKRNIATDFFDCMLIYEDYDERRIRLYDTLNEICNRRTGQSLPSCEYDKEYDEKLVPDLYEIYREHVEDGYIREARINWINHSYEYFSLITATTTLIGQQVPPNFFDPPAQNPTVYDLFDTNFINNHLICIRQNWGNPYSKSRGREIYFLNRMRGIDYVGPNGTYTFRKTSGQTGADGYLCDITKPQGEPLGQGNDISIELKTITAKKIRQVNGQYQDNGENPCSKASFQFVVKTQIPNLDENTTWGEVYDHLCEDLCITGPTGCQRNEFTHYFGTFGETSGVCQEVFCAKPQWTWKTCPHTKSFYEKLASKFCGYVKGAGPVIWEQNGNGDRVGAVAPQRDAVRKRKSGGVNGITLQDPTDPCWNHRKATRADVQAGRATQADFNAKRGNDQCTGARIYKTVALPTLKVSVKIKTLKADRSGNVKRATFGPVLNQQNGLIPHRNITGWELQDGDFPNDDRKLLHMPTQQMRQNGQVVD